MKKVVWLFQKNKCTFSVMVTEKRDLLLNMNAYTLNCN